MKPSVDRSKTEKDQSNDLEESLKNLKSYVPSDYYHENSYVDALDSFSTWRVGKIIQIKDRLAKVNFDGWSHKWDEKNTPPYTGANKIAIRDFDLDSSKDHINKYIDQMENIAKENFLINSPHYVTQTIRGEIYVLIDAMLSISIPIRTTKDMKLVTSIMEKYVEFFVRFLDCLPGFLRDYIDGRNINPQLYLVNDKIAAASCFPEIFDTMSKLFGGNERCLKLYQNTEFPVQQYSQNFAIKPREKYTGYQVQVINLINYFGQLGGFEKLLQLLKWESKIKDNGKSKTENEKEGVLRFPIYLYDYVIPLLQPLPRLLSSSIRDKFFGEFKTLFFSRMEKITVKEMKENDSYIGLVLIRDSNSVFEDVYGKEAYAMTEQAELDFALKMLKCPFLERKIKAMNEFKDFIDRADPYLDFRKLGDKKPLKHITQEKLKNWFIQQKVVEYILGDETHVELLKRASILFNFLCQTNGLSNEYLNLLWKSADGKYEEYVRAVYDTIIELSGLMTFEALEFVFARIESITVEEYTEMTINLIREYSLKAMSTVSNAQNSTYLNKSRKISNPKYEYFGLRLLWEAIQDTSKLDPKLFTAAFDSCVRLIKNVNFKTEREKYFTLCFDNLKANQSVPQSLILALHILTTFSGSGLFGIGNSVEDVVQKLNSKYGLIELTVTDIEIYMQAVAKAQERLKARGPLGENPTYIGKNSHTYNIEQRLIFIENINPLFKKPDLTFAHMKRLWNALVKEAVSDVETNLFLSWITKFKENSAKQRTYILGEPLIKQVFNNILCNPQIMDNFTNINLETFKCFERCFEIVNEKEDYLEITKNNTYRVHKFDPLIGVDTIWQILLNCRDEKVLKSLKHLLVALHLRVSGNNIEAKLKVWQMFVTKCLEGLQTGAQMKNPLITLNMITVLHSFILNSEGKKFLHKDSPNTDNVSFVVSLKSAKGGNQKKTIKLPSNATLFYLRKVLTEEFGLPLYDFEITLRDSFTISNDIEEDYAVTAITSKEKDGEREITITPKTIQSAVAVIKEKFKTQLGSNQMLMDTLFELLPDSNFKVANDTWELLTTLPPNKNLKTAFEKLNVESEEAWFGLLELSCTKKFLYTLQILCDICLASNSDSAKKDAWCEEFIEKKGFNHLMKLFEKIPTNELKATFSIKAMATLMKLIGFLIENYNKRLQLENSKLYNIRDILKKLLRGLLTVTSEPLVESNSRSHESVRANEEYVHNSFSIIMNLIKIDPSLINEIYSFSDLRLLILKGLIESPDSQLREGTSDSLSLLSLTVSQLGDIPASQKFNSFLLSFLLKNYLSVIVEYRDNSQQYFQLVLDLFVQSTETDLENSKIDFKGLSLDIVNMIIKLGPYETTSTGDRDYLLQGLLRLLEALFRSDISMKNAVLEKNNNFLTEILHFCLFKIPDDYSPNVVPPPKCKTIESRRAAFDLLYTILFNLSDRLTELTVSYLFAPLRKNFWRTGSSADWFIFPVQAERSQTGYVGLKNLGCTCYMNSLMQQFFMQSAFRESILATENATVKVEDHESLLLQFQMIMASLKRSQKQYYDPRSFCLAFKDYEGKPINVVEQMDVDEFFSNLLDKLEPYLKGSKNEGIIKRVYGGMLSNQLICKGCPHSSEREEPCLAISLKVKNKKNVYEGLQDYIQGDMLEGDNAYFCEKCEKKIPTLKRVCVKSLPNVLILVLKRFEFDFDTM